MQNDLHPNMPVASTEPSNSNKKVLAVAAVVLLFAAGVGVKAYLDQKDTETAERGRYAEYGLEEDVRDVETWSEYESPDGDFTVKFPSTPTHEENELPVENEEAIVEYDSYVSKAGDDSLYFVSVTKYQGEGARPTTSDDLENALVSMLDSTEGNELISSEEIEFAGRSALDVEIRNGALVLKSRMIANGQSMIQLMVVAPSENEIEEPYAAFIDSLVLP